MKNKIIKISVVLIVVLLVVLATTVNASGMIDNIQDSINMNTDAAKTATSFGNKIIGAIQVAGVGIAVIMLLYIAIKYIMAAPSEKAEYKKTAVSYVIGAVILFAAVAILDLIQNVMVELSGEILNENEIDVVNVVKK